MKLLTRQQRFAMNVSKLLDHIYHCGFSCTLGEAYRTVEQAEIYAREGKGIKNSLHCQRLAIDINLFGPDDKYLTDPEDYKYFGEFWEKLEEDNRWGGNFKMLHGKPFSDPFHFEMKA